MNKNSTRQVVIDRIYRLNGKEFQQLCWDILIKVFTDLQTPRPVHDLGSDGYTVKSSIFFACYAPESHEYDASETTDKINGDYKKFVDNWKTNGNFKKWVFLTKGNLIGAPHQKIVELNNNGDGVTKENWGVDQIVNMVMGLDIQLIKELFNLEDANGVQQTFVNQGIVNSGNVHIDKQVGTLNEYNQYSGAEQDENNAIEEVFNYVISQLPKTSPLSPTDEKRIEIREKIKLNFTDQKDQGEVERYFNDAFTRTKLVESKLQALDSQTQKDIELYISRKYSEFKRNSQSSMEILDKLFDFFTPDKRKTNPAYAVTVMAFVLLFFEDCTIFEKK
ncbi:MAG: hypothetical protein A2427_00435 [Candidatus Nealsonbacteria bacterium RIFOXYC1_FULL_40_7]|uniref:Uncharacterized protein n=2 Tax=Patescibacteria group TaxID=1783273 RepID=A0A1G2EQA1_9BACT|nr:MAG: hypothetical protein A2363_00145 [Candidatus Gottesmanbacteria bacterium RIFOXYB1_FULL_47_11]OGZ27973.1 MAG: hypothetical protein A2427_00435 [Candidatus Nealsonbacteria bacterium RIFOXYC1_FULL_40_7]